MDYNIRTAIEAGVPAIEAYRMGSYNTAKHFNIDHLVGAIAPGRYADLVFLSDVEKVTVAKVIANGKLAAENKNYQLPIPKLDYPQWAHATMNLERPVRAADFVITAPKEKDKKGTANIALLQPFYFAPELPTTTLPVTNGIVQANPDQGINKVAVVDRYKGTTSVSKMFWQNVGPVDPGSALASSQMHDIHNIWVLGNDDAAMALAANTVAEMDGGWALVHKGKVVAKVRLELGGLVSQRPVVEVAKEMEQLHNAADAMEWLGAPGLPERMRFAFLTASPWKWQLVAPYPENPGGLVNVTTGEIHPVVW
jgi:adenine deaminase